jgi:hypothetical protein
MTLEKMRIDIPFPIPRCVMSSPSHMMSPVPADIVRTISAILGGVKFGIRSTPKFWGLWKRKTSPVDWISARTIVT